MTNEELLKVIEKAKASRVTILDLSNKGIMSLPPELFQLTNLTELNLSYNQLTSLPPELFQLINLKILYLSYNQLTTLPPEICQLTKLTGLLLNGNQFTVLPSEIFRLPNLKRLYCGKNPLVSPPIEIAEQGIEAVRKYFTIMQEQEQPLNEVKLILVGEGSAGKTSLVKRLLNQPFDEYESTTQGISIKGWEQKVDGQKIRIHIWDFGGQEIQHATHQFFLSKRSLYVLVLDGRKDERMEYWLRHIEAFGGSSPVLVVLNKEDENPSFDVNRPFLLQKYPGIRGFFRTSCKSGAGIAQFKESLIEELGKVEMIGIRWPQSWFTVKQRIEQMSQPYISCEEYNKLCAEAGLAGEENRSTLLDFLHDLGVAVHFKDFILKAMHVLDPGWVTNAVYRIINAPELAYSQGILHLDSLGAILKHGSWDKNIYPAATHAYLIELMRKFELCYPINKEAVLIPQLLPVTEPNFSFDYSGALGFVLHYHHFLPPSIMPRLMVRLHKDIKAHTCWRTGLLLEDAPSGTQAVVKADVEARRIYLWVSGPRRKEYLTFLWFMLREINQSFEKLEVSERVPMPDDPQHTADYETLLKYSEAGIDSYIPDGSYKVYNVNKLLGIIEPDAVAKEPETLFKGMREKIRKRLFNDLETEIKNE